MQILPGVAIAIWAALLPLCCPHAQDGPQPAPRAAPLQAVPLESAASISPARMTNSLAMRFVLVPAGEFVMGSNEAPSTLAAAYPGYETRRLVDIADETPAHRVHITHAFWLGQHEVTLGQFRNFVHLSGYTPESEADGTGGFGYNPTHTPERSATGDAFEGRSQRYSWHNPGFAQSDDHPVVNVTWNDAVAMATWLSAREGATYRLPTEAEWEYACRAGGHSRYQAGDDPATLQGTSNTFDLDAAPLWPRWQAFALRGSDGYPFTSPVGRFAANRWGLQDMHGNAWEWVADWYAADYYAHSPTNDPTGPEEGEVRVRRGGSWHTWSFYARASFRNWNTPQTRYPPLGFRLLREVSASDGAPRNIRAAPLPSE